MNQREPQSALPRPDKSMAFVAWLLLTAAVIGFVAWTSNRPTSNVRSSEAGLLADVRVRPEADGVAHVGFTLGAPSRIAIQIDGPPGTIDVSVGLAKPASPDEGESKRALAPASLQRVRVELPTSEPVLKQVLFRVGTYLTEIRFTPSPSVTQSANGASKPIRVRVIATPERTLRDHHSQ